MNEHKKINLGDKTQININLGDNEITQMFRAGTVIHIVRVVIDAFLITFGAMLIFVGSVPTIYTTPPVMGPLISGAILCIIALVHIFLRKRKARRLNKLASLIVSSGLRRVDDIVRFSGMSEVKVIDQLRILTASTSSVKLGNDARYLKGGKLDLQTMEIKLSDKYIEKEPWTCVYCRASNEKDVLTCSSCQAPKKKV